MPAIGDYFFFGAFLVGFRLPPPALPPPGSPSLPSAMLSLLCCRDRDADPGLPVAERLWSRQESRELF